MKERQNRESGGRGEPLFCDLSALDDTQRKRRALLAEWLQVGTVEIDELPEGYAFHLDPVSLVAQHVDEFMALEKLCCPFVRLEVRKAGAVVVEIGGGTQIKTFVAAQFGIRGTDGHAG